MKSDTDTGTTFEALRADHLSHREFEPTQDQARRGLPESAKGRLRGACVRDMRRHRADD